MRSMRDSLRLTVALVLLVTAALGPVAAHELGANHPAEVEGPVPRADQMVAAPGAGLFTPPDAAAPQPQAAVPGGFIKRWRTAKIDPAYRDRMMAAAPVDIHQAISGGVDSFKLTLFDDVTVTIFKTGMHQDSLGTTIWNGRVVDAAGGEALFVIRDGVIGGQIRVGKQIFMIEPTADGGAKIVETDPDKRPHMDPLPVPKHPPAVQPSAPGTPPASATPPVQADGTPTVINILVAYTPAAAGSVTNIQSAISMGISYTNQVLLNSGINAQMNLVGAQQVNYSERGRGAASILGDAATGANGLSVLQTQRSALHADLVSLWALFNDACGIAYQLDDADTTPTAQEAPFGYNAISVSFGTGCLTDAVAHEIGHNMGAAHDRYVVPSNQQLPGEYNFGYVDIPDLLRTIMSYPDACTHVGQSCAIVPYHSSPNLTYQGHVLGIADASPNAADNVRRINEISPYIALFKSNGATQTLSVSATGTGTGTITSSPAGISCGATCSAAFAANSTVTLTAAPNLGSTFTGWSGGGCSGTSTCAVTMSADMAVAANFSTAPTFALSVSKAGTGSGTVTSAPSGISCGATCSASFNGGTSVTLSATAAGGSTFAGWSGGGCSGTSTCTVALGANTTVTATFSTIPTFALSVAKAGTGSGTVSSTPSGISCGATCGASFASGTSVTLTAVAASGSTFAGWSGGGCTGTSTCTMTVTADASVTATFSTMPTFALTVSKAGTGSGTVSSTPSGISCGATCGASFASGTSVTLNAAPASGSTFAGWSGGGCTGTSTCMVTLGANTTVTATFTTIPTTYTLTVAKAGAGAGTITSTPAGISCGATCSAGFNLGTSVALTAVASGGSVFVGWGGACSGVSTCTVPGSADATVTAIFMPTSLLTVAKAGTGAGLVTSNPAGITCGATCSTAFVTGSAVTLTAAATQGSVFTGWTGGGCSGTAGCIVTLNAASTVTATFTAVPTTAMLSIAKTGTGAGTVTSSPSGITCGVTCNASYTIGTSVTLSATADSGSSFTGWSGGGCDGNKSCVVTSTADTTVTANFVTNTATSISLGAAILPSGRSVQVGSGATLFGTMINSGPGTATFCTVAPATSVPAAFMFQTTDPATNALSGTANTPVDIPEGTAQSFLLAFTPSQPFSPTDIAFNFSCSNASAAPSYSGVNTLLLSASAAPVPDAVAIAGTTTNDGTLHISGTTGSAAFAVAIANVGSSAQMTALPDTGGANLPLTLSICQTNQATGACLAPPSASVPAQVNGNATASFGIFAAAHAAVPFMPAVNRIYVRFIDSGGVTRGSTSVAVETQ